MENHSKPLNFNQTSLPYSPGTDCAGCDEDFDNLTDDEREIATGLRHFAAAHGEAGQ